MSGRVSARYAIKLAPPDTNLPTNLRSPRLPALLRAADHHRDSRPACVPWRIDEKRCVRWGSNRSLAQICSWRTGIGGGEAPSPLPTHIDAFIRCSTAFSRRPTRIPGSPGHTRSHPARGRGSAGRLSSPTPLPESLSVPGDVRACGSRHRGFADTMKGWELDRLHVEPGLWRGHLGDVT